MKIFIFTLVVDGMRFLPRQLETYSQLKSDWHWIICEGIADSVYDTDWVAKMQPRFSIDGTTEWLNSLKNPNVTVLRRQLWDGKVSQCNAALALIKEPCVLLQCDCDELWRPEQLELVVHKLSTDITIDSMRFRCRFFLGPDIIATGENCWSNRAGEWHRAWRFAPGMLFEKHEPPVLGGIGRNCMDVDRTVPLGLVFDHHAYMYREQVAFKETYYKYPDAVKHWERLQANTVWPVQNLREFLPWVGAGVGADKITAL